MKKLLLLAIVCIGLVKFSLAQTESGYEISVIMPFCAKDLVSNPSSKNAAIGNACRTYFEGFALALDSFKNIDAPIDVKLYDTQRDSLTFKKILEKKSVQNSDLIVGPVLKEGNEMMMEFCKKNKIYHISPFLTLTKSKIDNPYMISAYPDLNYYADFVLEQIKETSNSDVNIIVITGKESNDKILSNRFLSLKTKYPSFTFKSLDISKYNEFKNLYKLGRNNKVVICSENEFLVGSTLKHLSDTTQFIDLEVFGWRKWLEFKAPNIPQMEHLGVKIISPFYMDYNDPACRLFIEKYRERYYTEPDEYAVAGYEQATYFISTLVQNHGNLQKVSEQALNKPLSNNYKIGKKPEAISLQNMQLNILFFADGKMHRY